jgi:flagella basal body P-ring formation protein FlgA
VRAGDTVSMTLRSGIIEAKGVGRAVSSGFIGDVIRVVRPGAREPYRARVIAPAAVEILQ